MCGIVGLISKSGDFSYYADDVFTHMLQFDSIRGSDSTGCFGVSPEGKVDFIKGDADGYVFTNSKNYGEFKNRINKHHRIVIGHNRKATEGAISAENAHPFQEKHIIMVHNGSIRNKKDLNQEVEVDSHAIAHALAEHDPVQALSKIDGAYALVWYDQSDRTLNLARNHERPLFLIEFEWIWAIASEPGLPIWLNAREGRKYKTLAEIPIEKIWTFKLDKLSSYFEIPYEEYKSWKAPVTPLVTAYPSNKTTTVSEIVTHRRFINDSEKERAKSLFKAGIDITWKLDDSKEDAGCEILLGHPLLDGSDLDTNIIVRHVLPRGMSGTDLLKVFDNEYWSGTIQNYRELSGVPTVYVKNIRPVKLLKDANQNQYDSKTLEEALKSGCTRCKGNMELSDVPKSVTRKHSQNGQWRLICPKCIESVIANVQKEKPGVTLRGSTKPH